jgi:hypothetical protein
MRISNCEIRGFNGGKELFVDTVQSGRLITKSYRNIAPPPLSWYNWWMERYRKNVLPLFPEYTLTLEAAGFEVSFVPPTRSHVTRKTTVRGACDILRYVSLSILLLLPSNSKFFSLPRSHASSICVLRPG